MSLLMPEYDKTMRDGNIIYIHIFPNGKVYIGQTSQTTAQRWARGKGYQGQLVSRAINKYGWDNIEHKILFRGLTKEQANEKEIELIAKYNSTNIAFGYNIAGGGDANAKGRPHSKEHNKKISDSHKKRVCSYSRDGKLIGTFESGIEAANVIGGSFRCISACCNGSK